MMTLLGEFSRVVPLLIALCLSPYWALEASFGISLLLNLGNPKTIQKLLNALGLVILVHDLGVSSVNYAAVENLFGFFKAEFLLSNLLTLTVALVPVTFLVVEIGLQKHIHVPPRFYAIAIGSAIILKGLVVLVAVYLDYADQLNSLQDYADQLNSLQAADVGPAAESILAYAKAQSERKPRLILDLFRVNNSVFAWNETAWLLQRRYVKQAGIAPAVVDGWELVLYLFLFSGHFTFHKTFGEEARSRPRFFTVCAVTVVIGFCFVPVDGALLAMLAGLRQVQRAWFSYQVLCSLSFSAGPLLLYLTTPVLMPLLVALLHGLQAHFGLTPSQSAVLILSLSLLDVEFKPYRLWFAGTAALLFGNFLWNGTARVISRE
jgi:hypothetical protein